MTRSQAVDYAPDGIRVNTLSLGMTWSDPFEGVTGNDREHADEVVAEFCLMGRVANHAVQIHGGYGLMKEYGVERFYRDQKLLDIGEGTSEIQRIVISRYIGC